MYKIYPIILILILLITGCGKSDNIVISDEVVNEIQTESNKELEEFETEEIVVEIKPEIYDVSLMAVGDNLYHSTVYKKGYKEDKYNFDFVYDNLKEKISSYDLAIINQETVFVDDYSNVSSYPCFGTPKECGDALINAGFDVVLGATNHSYDKRESGVLSTVNYWREHPEITFIGMYDNEEDYKNVTIVENNNIKIAMLNYTYGLNGFVIPDEKYYLVDTLYDKDKIQNDIEYAEENADITIVFPHWGNEYVYDETANQKEWAEFFTQHGADIIIGAHPHVVEPVKEIISENGNKSICYYSLGNFVSGQNEKPRILGGMATLNIRKIIDDGNVSVEITDNNFIPCVTHYNSQEHTVYLLEDYTDELANNSRMNATPAYLWDLWLDINEDSTYNYELPEEENLDVTIKDE